MFKKKNQTKTNYQNKKHKTERWVKERSEFIRTVKQSVAELERELVAFDSSQCRTFTLSFKIWTKIQFGA